jgi:putative transposase
MRRPRLKAPAFLPVAYYHCVSRVVNREFVLGEEEKDKLVEYMRTYERFGGLRVISYCIMSNHFHILVEVPQRPDAAALPDDAGWSRRSAAASATSWPTSSNGSSSCTASREHLEAAEELRESWFGRMWDVSAFMKVLKQRFTQWFNGRHARRGTLWEDRFRSVLVEGKGQALRAMAAYIDLNPVRAKICDDPKDYRWCGYAEAVAGGKEAREAVAFLAALNPHGGMKPERDTAAVKPKEALRRWRCHLFGIPENEIPPEGRGLERGDGRHLPRPDPAGEGAGGAGPRREALPGRLPPLQGPLLQRRRGDRREGLRGRDVRRLPRPLRAEAQGRRRRRSFQALAAGKFPLPAEVLAFRPAAGEQAAGIVKDQARSDFDHRPSPRRSASIDGSFASRIFRWVVSMSYSTRRKTISRWSRS